MRLALAALIPVVILCFSASFNDGEVDTNCKTMDGEQEKRIAKGAPPEVTLTIVFDNYKFNRDLKTGWGFSCHARVGGKQVLFDTGADSLTLMGNMFHLKINPDEIDYVVLSHPHKDHTGGLTEFIKHHNKVRVFLPKSFPTPIRERVRACGAECIDVGKPIRIDERISTGELKGMVTEQSLIINTAKGVVVVTGCAHPGILNVLKKVKEITGRDIYMAVGGFHLKEKDDKTLKLIALELRELGVKKVTPCHCSGDRCRKFFKLEFGTGCINIGVGSVVQV